MKASQKKNLVYSLDKSGNLKIIDFTKGEIKKNLKLSNILHKKTKKNDTPAQFYNFDVDDTDKNILFNKNMKIKLFNLDTNSVENIGVHSSQISFLKFSYDGKFIISMTNKDYFIYIWHKKSLNEPLLVLQQNSFTNGVQIKQIDKGLYHLFSYNKNFVYGYKILLSEIDPSVPIKPEVEIELQDKNFINLEMMNKENLSKNSPQSVFILYGKAFNAFNLKTKMLKYAKNSKIFTEKNIQISAKSDENEEGILKKGVNISQNVTVLNKLQMGDHLDLNDNDTINSTDIEEYKKTFDTENNLITEEKISLLNIIKNSIINNDNATFEWALDQKDTNLVDMTIRKMDSELINFFISKLIEIFQSNNSFKHNLIIWLDLLFKHHMILIVKLPKKTQMNLKNIQILIENRTKNLDRLEELGNKLESLMTLFGNKNKNSKIETQVVYEPLLVYNESDSEDDKMVKLKEKMTERGIKKTTESELLMKRKTNYEEDIEMTGDEDLAVDDIDDDFDIDAEIEDDIEADGEKNEINEEDLDDESDAEN